MTPLAYGAEAGLYDERTARFQGYRDRIVTALGSRPGDVVLDVGCGTGLCFDGLRKAVGSGGRVVGIEESGDMVRLARPRAARRGWAKVSVLHSTAGEAEIPIVADRALFCTVHDILQSFESLRNVFEHLRPGRRRRRQVRTLLAHGPQLADAPRWSAAPTGRGLVAPPSSPTQWKPSGSGLGKGWVLLAHAVS